jgi:hypothetical protein
MRTLRQATSASIARLIPCQHSHSHTTRTCSLQWVHCALVTLLMSHCSQHNNAVRTRPHAVICTAETAVTHCLDVAAGCQHNRIADAHRAPCLTHKHSCFLSGRANVASVKLRRGPRQVLATAPNAGRQAGTKNHHSTLAVCSSINYSSRSNWHGLCGVLS